MKIFKKIFLFLFLFNFFVLKSFAFDASINVDKNVVATNNYFNLQLKIESSEPGEIKVKKIYGIENFDILGQSQSQSSSSQVEIINGKTKMKNTTIINLDLTLKPKKAGILELGPVILSKNNKNYQTNSIKIKVEKKGIFLNNSPNNLITTNNNTTNNNIGNNINTQNNKNQNNKIEDFEKNIKKKNFNNNNNIIILFIILSFIGILSLIYFKQKNQENNITKNSENFKESEDKNIKDKENIIDFEKNNEKIYDNIEANDKDFCLKIDKIFRQKLEKKFNIKNIYNKTFDEIINEIPENNQIREISDLLNKLKYSNIIEDKEKVLQLIKNF